jgi:hypothetical protein
MQREWHQTIIEIKAKTRQLVLARMLSNAQSFLASDINNLNKDLGNINVPGSISLQDYAKAGFDYGQIQGFNQAMTTLGNADLGFLLASSSGSSAMLSLLNISNDIKKANNDLVHAMSLANRNPPGDFLAQGFVSILTAVS